MYGRVRAVGTSEVDATLGADDIADTSSLGTAEINEASLFNDSSLDGTDINEAGLGVVPSATRLAGTEIRQFSFGGGETAVRTTILSNFHGLTLAGDCDSGPNVELFATTSATPVNPAWMLATKFDINGSVSGGGVNSDEFDNTQDLEIQAGSIYASGFPSYGQAPQATDLTEKDDVTVIYAASEHTANNPKCAISGIAFGG